MLDAIVDVLKKNKSLFIVIFLAAILFGGIWGFFIKKHKKKIIEINPKEIYRELTLSKIADMKKLKERGLNEVEEIIDSTEEESISKDVFVQEKIKEAEKKKIENKKEEDRKLNYSKTFESLKKQEKKSNKLEEKKSFDPDKISVDELLEGN